MTNKFPRAVTAGTTISFQRADSRYPASAGWSYSLACRIPGFAGVTAEADGDAFAVSITASTSASWVPGTYAYSERVTKGDEVHEIGSGSFTVRPNLALAKEGDDGRTHNERVLAMLEALIEGRATDGIENYSIAGRAVSKLPFAELVKQRERYQALVVLERRGGRLGVMYPNFGGVAK